MGESDLDLSQVVEARVAAGRRSMLVGGAIALIGLAVTAGSYFVAAPGGSYLVASGAVVLGALQFLQGLARAGRDGLGLAVRLLLVAGVVVASGWLLVERLSGMTRTYTDSLYDVSVQYPLLWQAEVEDDGTWHQVDFSPRYGWTGDNRRLQVVVEADRELANWSPYQGLSYLKYLILTSMDATLIETALTTVDGHHAGYVAYETMEPSGEVLASRAAVFSTPDGITILNADQLDPGPGELEAFYAQFVASYRSGRPGAADGPPPEEPACGGGWDGHVAGSLGFRACYPLEWVAWEELGDDETLPSVTFLSPLDDPADQGRLTVAMESLSGLGWLTNDDLSDLLTDWAGEEGGRMISGPAVVTVAGLPAIRAAWEIAEGTGQAMASVERATIVWDADRLWYISAWGPSTQADAVQRIHDQFLASFELLGAE